MRTQSSDMRPEVERMQIEIMRGFSIARKFEIVANLTDSMASINRFYRQDLNNRIKQAYGPKWVKRSALYRQKHPDRLPATIDVKATVLLVIASLEQRGIAFALAGRIACAFYGLPSSLYSIELQVAHPHHVQLSPYHTRIGDAALDMRHYMLVEVNRTEEKLARVQRLPLIEGHQLIPVLAPEDVALDLLTRFAQTGKRDDALYNDLLGMIKIQSPTLDRAYLMHQADNRSLLTQLLRDGGILP